jgi:biotin-dependent carboxylase-like uncharacterized protein
MTIDVCQIEAVGMRISVQDRGRPGWARYGVPTSGAIDQHATTWANQLLGNDASAPVLELLGRGARLKFLRATWVAVTGASSVQPAHAWRAAHVAPEEVIPFSRQGHGLWTYVAVEGGFNTPRWLGSASVYARGGIGRLLEPGDVLRSSAEPAFHLPPGVSSRVAPWTEQRDYGRPPALRVSPAPQWDLFSDAQREQLFLQEWTLSPRSDRSGYRLAGVPIQHQLGELVSEPIMVGTIQVPPDGQPIVTMCDGPTVGGYAKIGIVDPADLSWLAQTQPGQGVRFRECPLT